MYAADDVGPGYDQVFVAALVLRASEVVGPKVAGLDRRAHGAVQYQDSFLEQPFQCFYSFLLVHKLACHPVKVIYQCSTGGDDRW